MARGRGRKRHSNKILSVGAAAVFFAAALVDDVSSVCLAAVVPATDITFDASMVDGASSVAVATVTDPTAVAAVASMNDDVSSTAVTTITNPTAVTAVASMNDDVSSTAVTTITNPTAVTAVASMNDDVSTSAVATVAQGGIDSFTKLMLHFNGTNGSTTITDSSASPHTFTAVGNAQLDTGTKKFGTASLLLDGTGDYLNGDNHADFTFGTGDFTIDFWFIPGSVAITQVLYEGRPPATSGAYPLIYAVNTGLRYHVSGSDQISGGTLVNGTATHITIARSGTATKMFQDGVQIGSTYTDSSNYLAGGTSRPRIGANEAAGAGCNGRIDELRVSKGIARWTTTFTPPTLEYTT